MAGSRRELEILRKLDAGVSPKEELAMLRELDEISPVQAAPQQAQGASIPIPTPAGTIPVPADFLRGLPGKINELQGGFLESAQERLGERGQSLIETGQARAAGDIGNIQSGVQVGGQIAGGALDVLGEGVTTAAKGVGHLIPEGVKDTAVQGTLAGLRALAGTDVGKAGVKAIKSGAEAYGRFKTENPQAAKTMESAVNMGLLVAPVKGKPSPRSILGREAVKLKRKASLQTGKAKSDFIADLIQPTLTKKEATKKVSSMTEEGILRTRVINLTSKEKKIAAEVARVPGINKNASMLHNRIKISEHNKKIAGALELVVDKAPIDKSAWVKIQIKTPAKIIDDAVEKLVKRNPLVVGDAEKTAIKIANEAKRLIAKNPQTPSGLLTARKQLDRSIKRFKGPNVFKGETENAVQASVKVVRDATNKMIVDSVPDVNVHKMLNRQTNLFRALDNIDPKVAQMQANVLWRMFDKLAPVGPMRTRFIQGLGTVSGLGVIGASATFSQPLAAALGGLGIVYAGNKIIMSPTAKKSVATLLRLTDRAILSSKKPSIVRQLRADRAIIADMLKNSKIEESNGNQVQQ